MMYKLAVTCVTSSLIHCPVLITAIRQRPLNDDWYFLCSVECICKHTKCKYYHILLVHVLVMYIVSSCVEVWPLEVTVHA